MPETKNLFILDGISLTIDLAKSEIQTQPDGFPWIEINTEEEEWKELTKHESHKYSWATFPPYFYMRGIPAGKEGNDSAIITKEERGWEEAALYLMQHHDIDGEFQMQNGVFVAFGKAQIQTDEVDYQIRFDPRS